MNPGGIPSDSAALSYMPAQLVGLITPEHFMYISGFAGMVSALVVIIIFSRGL